MGLIAAGIFFAQNSSLKKEAKTLQSELTKTQKSLTEAEKKLIYYQNTDLAKEVEILKLKLATAEKDLAASVDQVSSLQKRVDTLEANSDKIQLHLEAINAINEMFFGSGPSEKGVAQIDVKIAALKDSEITNLWQQAKAGIDTEKRSWGGDSIGRTLDKITSRVSDLLP